MVKYILSLDQGTSSSRAVVFDMSGQPVSISQTETSSFYPNSGWVEQDSAEIIKSQLLVAKQAIDKIKISSSQISAIGITNQRETTIIWDKKSGKAVYPAISWQDRRTAAYCRELNKQEPVIFKKTGLVLDPYFSASKIRWILDFIPNGQSRAEAGELAFGTVDSWILWNLSKNNIHASDQTNASRTMLFNINTFDWDEELLNIFSIPKILLPKVMPSSSFFAEAKGEFDGVPITSLVGDQQSSLFGQVCFKKGMVKNTYGTGCFLLMNIGEKIVYSNNKLITTVCADNVKISNYVLEGSVFVAGSVVKWLRDGLEIISSALEVEKIATSVEDSGGVYFVPAFTGLGAPYWDPSAKGVISGLSFSSTKAHIVRAAIESMALQTCQVLNAMEKDSLTTITEMRVDGGASANNFLLQFQADILNVPVIRSKVLETTALGAAYLAGLHVGVWKDKSDLEGMWQNDRIFEPKMSTSNRDMVLSKWKEAVNRAKTNE